MKRIIQITTSIGQRYSVEVDGPKQFNKLKRKATWRKGGFFFLFETCHIRRKDIVVVEYLEWSEQDEESQG